jgi:hypothetical protein
MLKIFLTLFTLILFTCSSIKLTKTPPLATISFNIELTSANQQTAGDSLGAELARRLLVYSEEKKDFRLVRPGEKADYALKIRITSFHVVSSDTQISLNRSRRAIENKYDRINDSLHQSYRPMSGGQLAAANIVSNVVLNAALLPLGFVGVAVISNDGPETVGPSFEDRKAIGALLREANLGYQAEISDAAGKIKWKKSGTEYYTLDYVVSEKEQLTVLVRNVVLEFENDMPFLTIRD